MAHFNGLKNLSELDLANTRVTDVGLAHLKGLTSLSVLDLSNTRVTDARLAHIEGLYMILGVGLLCREPSRKVSSSTRKRTVPSNNNPGGDGTTQYKSPQEWTRHDERSR